MNPPLKFPLHRHFSFATRLLRSVSDGSPLDMSGNAAAVFSIANGPYRPTGAPLTSVSTQSGGIVIHSKSVEGQTFYYLTISLIPADTQTITAPGEYFYQVQIRDAAGRDYNVDTGDAGRLVLEPSIDNPL